MSNVVLKLEPVEKLLFAIRELQTAGHRCVVGTNSAPYGKHCQVCAIIRAANPIRAEFRRNK